MSLGVGIKIEELPATGTPSLDHQIPAMNDGLTVKLSLNQVLSLLSVGAGFLPTTGGILSGDLKIDETSARLQLDKVSGNVSGILFSTNEGSRWGLFSHSTGETGSNAGSPFRMVKYLDDGTTEAVVFEVNRLTGVVDFKVQPTVNGVAIGSSSPHQGVNWEIRTNPNVIAANLTIPAGSNGMTAGPVTVNSGVTVEVAAGSQWTIV